MSGLANSLLSISLAVVVPLWAEALKEGGQAALDREWKKFPDVSTLLAEKGDQLLFRSNKRGETAKLFNEMARAIAALSFVPGGVTVFGQHWESKL